MSNLIETLRHLAHLQLSTTPRPWVSSGFGFQVIGGEPATQVCNADGKRPEYEQKGNSFFIAAAGSTDFAALLATALATTPPAPLADAALAELEALEQRATAGPWVINTNPKKWVGNNSSDAVWADNRDNDAAFVAAVRNALPCLLARVRAAEATLAAVGEAISSQQDKAVADGIAAAKQHGDDSEQFTVASARLMEVQLIGLVMEGSQPNA